MGVMKIVFSYWYLQAIVLNIIIMWCIVIWNLNCLYRLRNDKSCKFENFIFLILYKRVVFLIETESMNTFYNIINNIFVHTLPFKV